MYDVRIHYSSLDSAFLVRVISNANKEYYVSEWICNKWICAQRDDWCCLDILDTYTLHEHELWWRRCFSHHPSTCGARLFREPAREQFWSDQWERCSAANAQRVIHRQCLFIAPLYDEAIRRPFLLLQLAWIRERYAVWSAWTTSSAACGLLCYHLCYSSTSGRQTRCS